MSGFLFDTNVLLDIATADPLWLARSEAQFRTYLAQGPILINPIIYAELAPAFASLSSWIGGSTPVFSSDSHFLTRPGGRPRRPS